MMILIYVFIFLKKYNYTFKTSDIIVLLFLAPMQKITPKTIATTTTMLSIVMRAIIPPDSVLLFISANGFGIIFTLTYCALYVLLAPLSIWRAITVM